MKAHSFIIFRTARLISLLFVFTVFFAGLTLIASASDTPTDAEKTYTVQPGDHLFGISEKFGVSINELRSANGIDGNVIIPGQKLTIPTENPKPIVNDSGKYIEPEKDGVPADGVPADGVPPDVTTPDCSSSNVAASDTPVSLDIRNADIRDVLSAMALKMNINILYIEPPDVVDFKVRGVSSHKAFELFLQQEGLDYIKDGRLYIVGQESRLQGDFFNQMVLTRFNLKHLTAPVLEDVLSDLGIPLQSITMDENRQNVWIQATPISLSKICKVIETLDRPENAEGLFNAFVYQLSNTVVERVQERLDDFGFEEVAIVPISYSQFTQELLVICPPHLESQVYSAISKLDEDRNWVRVPVDSLTGANARRQLIAERELLSELTGVSINRMHISDNLSGDSENPRYVLWIEESPDKVQLIADMLDDIR